MMFLNVSAAWAGVDEVGKLIHILAVSGKNDCLDVGSAERYNNCFLLSGGGYV